ncbi:MAG: AzlC family ABC transporter permease [Acidimicrobiia bacterium]|nr:AzlC family ABC transporter permease [Acidimicrobiia bacterium]
MAEVDRSIVRRAIFDSLPLFAPAIPFAFVIGLTIVETGFPRLLGWSTAPIIFGGSAQLVLISLLGGGTAAVAAITAGLVVNARHIMYSAALAPTFQSQPRWMRWLAPYLLIDQIFALASLRSDDDPASFRTYYLACAATFWPLWLSFVAIGLFIGPVVPVEWNLGFAVPILFLGLVVMGIDKYPKLVAALVGAGVTFVAAGMPHRTGLLVGALAGIAAGTVAEKLRES